MFFIQTYVPAQKVRFVERQIQNGFVLELELYGLLFFSAEIELHNAVVSAHAVPQVHDIVALAELGEIEKLVDLRAVREHPAARLELYLRAPAEELAHAHKRRALCVGRKYFPVGADIGKTRNHETRTERVGNEFAVEFYAGVGEHPPCNLPVSVAVDCDEYVYAVVAPLPDFPHELLADFRLRLETLRAHARNEIGGSNGQLFAGETAARCVGEHFARKIDVGNRSATLVAVEHALETARAKRQILGVRKQLRKLRLEHRGRKKYPLGDAVFLGKIVGCVALAERFGIGNGVEPYALEPVVGKLRVGIKRADGLHLVAEKIEPYGELRSRRINVDHAAAHGKLTGAFAQNFVVIAEIYKLFTQAFNRNFRPFCDFETARKLRRGRIVEKSLGRAENDCSAVHGIGLGDCVERARALAQRVETASVGANRRRARRHNLHRVRRARKRQKILQTRIHKLAFRKCLEKDDTQAVAPRNDGRQRRRIRRTRNVGVELPFACGFCPKHYLCFRPRRRAFVSP